MRRFITAVSLIALATPSIAAPLQDAAPAAAPADPAAAREAAKAAKAAAKAEARRMAQLRAQYGDGPYPDQIAAYVDARTEALRPLYRTLYTGGERNAVLNFQRLGLAAFEGGHYKDAAWAFDQALARIEAIYGDNKQAEAARSIFHNEANKDFKGEPYERAMAYYYRGLLYLRDGDYQNARISFREAERMDTLSDAEQFQSDFAAMNYLQGWSLRCQGRASDAKEYFDLATKAQKGLTAPAEGDNVLFIGELGNGPVKARDGAQAQKLLFQAGEAYPETLATITYGATGAQTALPLVEASSVTYQATTRGGRALDGLMNGKANWKEGTDSVGNALMTQGLMGGDGGGYMAMAGLALSLFSGAMKTKADVRAWDGLPDRIMVGTARAASPDWTYTVAYAGEKGPVEAKGMTMRADAKGCGIVWARSRPAVYAEGVVGEDAGVAASQARKRPTIEKNKAFRAALESQTL
ncbi:hypothetical protein [Sphingomonas hankookensis]|uniref:hypothetical protein n=1 Tax=Sphingomonas hankookensis TaxID=563996 RepID=UPI00234F3DF3|nr:hypothetical protein [Sphingomonas hankookensis]WCP73893.1 hypothetical protein PPZ50_18195 [Sphingomonas hankookensis]